MTRVRTRRHLSRLLVLFSSSEVLPHARHCLILFLLGLTSLRTVLSCDGRMGAHESRDLDPTFARSHVAVRRYPEWRNLASIENPEWWMRRKGNGASSMVGQSASDAVDDRHQPGDSSQGNRRSSAASTTTRRTDDAASSLSVIGADDRRSGDSLENRRRTGDGIVFRESMRQSGKSAEHRLKEEYPSGVGETGFTTIPDRQRRGTGNFAEGHDRRDATVEEAPIVDHVTRLRSRRDRNGNGFGTEHDTAGNVARSIDRAGVRHSAAQSGTRETESGRVAAKIRRDDLAGGSRNDRGIIGLEVTTTGQTRSDIGNVYNTLDNRSDGARGSASSTSDYYAGDNFDSVANDSANSRANDGNVDVIVHDTIVDYVNGGGVASIEQRRVAQVSEIGNRTEANSENAENGTSNHGGIMEIRRANCRGGARSAAGDDNDNAPPELIGTSKFGGDEDHLARMSEGGGSDGDADTDVVAEAPPLFTGFDGSQKFPVKIDRKSAPPHRFDRRHFGPHEENNVLEKTTLAWWYPSTADLPKSPSRDSQFPRRTNGDGNDDRVEEAEKRNGTRDESFGGPGTGSRSPGKSEEAEPEGFAVTTDDSDAEGTSRGSPDTGIDVTVKSTEKTNVTILGLFEMTQGTMPRPEGSSELEAAKLAVDRVNELDILKRFRLRLIYNDTKVSRPIWPEKPSSGERKHERVPISLESATRATLPFCKTASLQITRD